ncbi:Heme A synthase, cytochrome oxidase biogenesis protein Cox15-CtaA [Caenispirillum salinarum AK4]|uniref:Heme A synthase, cytochrome oxidase biogenesis protein Cox15-CtaA n=2 Tax=Caenispirillum TaxID=414051 RepID=K9GY60_9PROT|nr:Heme A synthase, cytochrome oxidase biogenesis protein Cox15-CtaA [Caenispirillum salinarum AK4]
MVVFMACLGAATRLTDSGLSMVEWQVFTILPPLSQAEWQATFDAYRQSPQYLLQNAGMSLEAFKGIFWLEYLHRLWGRIIGVAFAVPFLVFLVKGAIDARLGLKLGGLFVLGGMQGLVGWIMVQSGLVDQPMVSPVKLAAHLGLAVLILGLLWRLALDLWLEEPGHALPPPARRLAAGARAFLIYVFVVILSGALVAGLDAGLTYNTFPLMDGDLVPDGLLMHAPWWVNHLDNITTVQFQHRVLATALVAFALGLAAWAWRTGAALPRRARTAAAVLGALAVGQMALGIATLLAVVPLSLGVLHQLGALIVFLAAVTLVRLLRRPAVSAPQPSEQR